MKTNKFLPAFILGEKILAPLLEMKLNETFHKMTILPINLRSFSLAPPAEQKIYQITTQQNYSKKFRNYSLIFNIYRRFIPEYYDFKAQFIIEIKIPTGEVFKTLEMYRFQKEKLIHEELETVKCVLVELFENFSEGEF